MRCQFGPLRAGNGDQGARRSRAHRTGARPFNFFGIAVCGQQYHWRVLVSRRTGTAIFSIFPVRPVLPPHSHFQPENGSALAVEASLPMTRSGLAIRDTL
jgi:hypothetical protein